MSNYNYYYPEQHLAHRRMGPPVPVYHPHMGPPSMVHPSYFQAPPVSERLQAEGYHAFLAPPSAYGADAPEYAAAYGQQVPYEHSGAFFMRPQSRNDFDAMSAQQQLHDHIRRLRETAKQSPTASSRFASSSAGPTFAVPQHIHRYAVDMPPPSSMAHELSPQLSALPGTSSPPTLSIGDAQASITSLVYPHPIPNGQPQYYGPLSLERRIRAEVDSTRCHSHPHTPEVLEHHIPYLPANGMVPRANPSNLFSALKAGSDEHPFHVTPARRPRMGEVPVFSGVHAEHLMDAEGKPGVHLVNRSRSPPRKVARLTVSQHMMSPPSSVTVASTSPAQHAQSSSPRGASPAGDADGEDYASVPIPQLSSPEEFHTQTDLVTYFHLPRRFRFRDARRVLLERCSPAQRQYITENHPHSEVITKLPHRLTARHFATCCTLLAFHYAAMNGEIPSFWTSMDAAKLLDCLPTEIYSEYRPEIGALVAQQRRIRARAGVTLDTPEEFEECVQEARQIIVAAHGSIPVADMRDSATTTPAILKEDTSSKDTGSPAPVKDEQPASEAPASDIPAEVATEEPST